MVPAGRLMVGVLAVVALAGAGEARAQWGYGSYPGAYRGYGWGGWGGGGGTVQGSIARGLGMYAAGAGAYNVQTAQARSINANTAMQWNQYWYQAQVHANSNERKRLARRQARDSGTSAAIETRIRENPSPADIDSGDALNAALDQVTDPRVQDSSLRLATATIPARIIREIPFFVATESATITLDQLTGDRSWPFALRDGAFSLEREAVSKAVDRALEQDVEGDVTPETIQRLRAPIDRLHDKFEANRPADPAAASAAEDYLKSLSAFIRMLERPDIDKVIAELDTIKETTLGNLLGFMHTFDLRFGRPKTPAQRAAYEQIYPQMDVLRDRVVKTIAGDDKVPPLPAPPTTMFSSLSFDHLNGPHQIIEKPAK